MIGGIVNLRLARKARRRAEAEQAATQNRALHGRTKAERDAHAREAARLDKLVEGARLERDD